MYQLEKFSQKFENEISSKLEKLWGKEIFKPGLESINHFLKDHPVSHKPQIITVAGTNGKGETSRFITHLLKESNKSAALWTSPHLVSITERFYSSKMGLISYEKLNELIERVETWQQESEVVLSYYELLFCCFVLWMKELRPEFIVFEVGLGGRLDAVNAFEADFVALTSIGRDHQEILGTRYDKILFEKFGVCRSKTSLFSGIETEYLNQKLQGLVKNLNCKWERVFWKEDEDFSHHNRRLAASLVEEATGEKQDLEKHIKASLNPILGDQNIGQRKISFYGSHNPEGLRKLVQFLLTSPYTSKDSFDVLLFSLSRRKIEDIKIIMEIISQLNIPKKMFVPLVHHKGQPLSEIFSILEDNDFEVCPISAHEFVKTLPVGTRILATGSNYFIGDLYTKLRFGEF